MITKQIAKRLDRPQVIDLKYIIYKEYCDKVENKKYNKGIRNKIKNFISYIPWYIGVIIIILFIIANVFKINPTFADNQKYYKIETISTPLPAFLYDNLKISCKDHKVKNLHHCIKTGLSIAYAESTWDSKYNYFGLTSKDKSIKSWVIRYTKYWYKAKEGGRFYGYSEKQPAETRYCVSEDSSGSVGYCPNGRKNFNYIFLNKELDKFIKNNLR